MNILMPLGISYFLFESISYVSDVYYSKYEHSNNIFKVASYISFFPCVTCGPIIRYNNFSNFYESNKTINYDSIADGFRKFILGLAKKVIIADQIGHLASVAFDSTTVLSTPLAWAGVIAAGLQIYYDFSGYSDMAIGVARMIGFEIDKNFNYPFVSKSWSEFWRRWHISLGTWFRDYVYIPLGGNRVKTTRFIFNLLLVWTLTGIWHGSTINYVLWGLVVGITVVIEKLTKIRINNVLGILIVNLLFFSTVAIFKSSSIESMSLYLKTMYTWTGISFNYIKLLGILYLWPIIILAVLFVLPKTMEILKKNKYVFDILILASLILSIVFIVGGTQQTFVYFAF